jgi:hypothetical protein
MFDAVNAKNIPRSAQMVAGYSDTISIPQWSQSDWDLFPNAKKIQIVKKASSNWGTVLDVETGDATPAEAPGWVSMRRGSGGIPVVYCNYFTWPAVRKAFIAQNVPEPMYWIADYDNVADFVIGPGPNPLAGNVVAKQYANTPGYDLSVVRDFWPGVDDAAILPTVLTEDPMLAPAATDDYIDVPTDGRRNLFISSSYGRHVNVKDIVCVGDTPGPIGADYIAEGLTTLDVAPDRPGSIGLPAGVRVTKVRYAADHPFTIWTV